MTSPKDLIEFGNRTWNLQNKYFFIRYKVAKMQNFSDFLFSFIYIWFDRA